MSDTAHVFAEIVKMAPQDDGSLLVQGRASDSNLDLDQQICDPVWLARAMPEWFKIGNVREQHDARRAVGKATEYDARDDGHYITAKIVDPVAKAKTEAGIFTGFSIGVKAPRIAKSKAAPGGVIHDGKIIEVSLVDRPANAGCTLTLVKAAEPGWEGKAGDLDEERGLVRVEELHEPDTTKDEDVACPAPGSVAAGDADMDEEAAAAVLAVDSLATALDIPDEQKAAALADAIEKASQADDIAGARDALTTIFGLIASEAAEGAVKPCEDYDIALLLQAVQALRRFIQREQGEDSLTDPAYGPPAEVAMAVEPDVWKRKWSKAERDRAAREGHARPDGSFPIETAEDVEAAVHLAKSPEEQAWVKRRAKAVGATDKIPNDWQASGAKKGAMSDTTETTDPTEQDGPAPAEGADPAAAEAQPPSTEAPGDQADPDGDATKAGKKKPADDSDDSDDSDEEDDSEDEDDEDTDKATSPELVKAFTDALADDDSELRKALGDTITAIVEDSMKSAAATLDALAGRVEQIEQMAAPGGPALRRTEADRTAARRGDLERQAAHYKALALSAEDMDLRKGYHAQAAKADAALKALALTAP